MPGYQPPESGNWRWNGREWVDMSRPRRPMWPWLAAGLLLLVVIAVAAYLVLGLGSRGRPAGTAAAVATSSPSPRPSSAPTASAAPSRAPTPSPAASALTTAPSPSPAPNGAVSSVQVQPNGPCAPGGPCALEVTVSFPLATAAEQVAWSFQATDACTGTSTDLGTDQVTAQAGWNHVIGDRSVNLPAGRGPVRIVATTTSPGQAASAPLQVGSGSC